MKQKNTIGFMPRVSLSDARRNPRMLLSLSLIRQDATHGQRGAKTSILRLWGELRDLPG